MDDDVEWARMIYDKGARRDVPQLMQVVLVKMWMVTMAVNEVIRTEMMGMRANSCRKTQAGDYDVGRVGRSGEIVIKTWKEFVLPC